MGCTASKHKSQTVVAPAVTKPAVATPRAAPVPQEREIAAEPTKTVEEPTTIEEALDESTSTPATEVCVTEIEAVREPIAEEPTKEAAVETPAAPVGVNSLKSCVKDNAFARALLKRKMAKVNVKVQVTEAAVVKVEGAAETAVTEHTKEAAVVEAKKDTKASKKTEEKKDTSGKNKKKKSSKKSKKDKGEKKPEQKRKVPALNAAALEALAAQVATVVNVPKDVTPLDLFTACPIESVRYNDENTGSPKTGSPSRAFVRLPSAMKSARTFGAELKGQEEAAPAEKKTVKMTNKKEFVKPKEVKKPAEKNCGNAKTKKGSKRAKKILGVDKEIYKQQIFAFQRMLTHASMLSEQLNCA